MSVRVRVRVKVRARAGAWVGVRAVAWRPEERGGEVEAVHGLALRHAAAR